MSGDPFGLIGEVIGGQFRVEALAGDADLSVVYRARRLGSTLSVAIKCLLLPETLSDALARALDAAFYRAYRVHDRLARGNANIAQTITSGEAVSPRSGAPVPYLVREWLEGESLAAELAARHETIRPMRPLEEVLGLLHGAFDGVAFAHANGEAHLGINPGNLFVAKGSDGSASLKVLDFGLARMMNDFSPESPSESHSGCGLRLLLAGYAAPEQIDETIGPVGPRSDVYALATVAMEALSGHRLPPQLDQVLNRALASAPEARQESAAELWREISGAVVPRPPRVVATEGRGSSAALVVGAVARLKLPAEASDGTQPMTFEPRPPPAVHVAPQRPPEPNDPSSTPPWKIPSEAPPGLSPGSSLHPSLPPARPGSLLKRRIAIGACGAAVASLVVLTAVAAASPTSRWAKTIAALRWHGPFAARTNATGGSPSAEPPAIEAASRPVSSGASAEKPAPAAQGPIGSSAAAASYDTQTPFAPGTARHGLDSKKRELAKCNRGKAWGYGLATVTFANDGTVDRVVLAPPLAGTQTGECASATLAATRIAPFAGTSHSVVYKFYVAPK